MYKTKLLIISIAFIFTNNALYSQSWHTYFGDSIWGGADVLRGITIDDDTFIIAGGSLFTGNDTTGAIAKWNNYSWTGFDLDLGSGIPESLLIYKNKLYVSGSTSWKPNAIENTHGFAVWDGEQWLPPGQPEFGDVRNMRVINDSLYVVGDYVVGGKILVYDGHDWQNIGPIPAPRASSVIEYNGELLVGGNYGLYKRTGYNDWEEFPGSPQGWVNAMLVDSINNFLYAGGSFYYIGDTIYSLCLGKYDGYRWYPLEQGVWGDIWYGTMEMYRGELYFGGVFSATVLDNTPIKRIARWDGERIRNVGGGVTYGMVYDLKVFQDTLIVVGAFDYVNALSEDSIRAYSMAKWYMPPGGCNFLQPVLHAWQVEGVSQDEFFLVNGEAEINFYNNNAYADSWQWDFGTLTSSERNPSITFTSPGEYNIQLTVIQDGCVKTIDKNISIYLNTGTEQKAKDNFFEVFPNPAKENAKIRHSVPKNVVNANIIVLSANGQVLDNIKLNIDQKECSIDLSQWQTDFVILNLLFDNKQIKSKKLIIEK
ncbi:MAG: PKD domain-containing protein [Bacteroidales bacterium]|nr:PKD domain-containing protein [Bacteroidales bacterium]